MRLRKPPPLAPTLLRYVELRTCFVCGAPGQGEKCHYCRTNRNTFGHSYGNSDTATRLRLGMTTINEERAEVISGRVCGFSAVIADEGSYYRDLMNCGVLTVPEYKHAVGVS